MKRNIYIIIFMLLSFVPFTTIAQIEAQFQFDEDGDVNFCCYNNYSQYGYYGYPVGVDISNYAFYVNGEGPFAGNYSWRYQTIMVISSDNYTFSEGDNVSLYVNGNFIDSWVCDIEKPSMVKNVYNWIMDNKPRHTRLPSSWKKNAMKYLKKIRL